jgi:hypothetical protein
MFVIYVLLWAGFAMGAIAVAGILVVAGIRILAGWRPRPTRRRAVSDIRVLAASSAFAFAYGAWGWFSYSDDDASLRAQTVVPPFAFGTATLIAAVSIAVVWTFGQRTAASDQRGSNASRAPSVSSRSRRPTGYRTQASRR